MALSLLKSSAALCVSAILLLIGLSTVSAQVTVQLTVQQPADFLKATEVTVNWEVTSGQYDPTNDYISSWWEPFSATYLQWFPITGNSGSATFSLLNGRAPIFFRYYSGDSIIAQSDTVVPEGSYPTGIHVQFVPQHPDRAMIIWTSNRTSGNGIVYYGTQSGSLSSSAGCAKHATYTHSDLANKVGQYNPVRTTQFQNLGARDLRCVYGTCYNDSTATELFVDPGMFHYAELTGLTGNSIYYFQVGESNGYMSNEYAFHSRVAPGPENTVQILYVADAGVGRTWESYTGSASHNSIPTKYGDAEGGRQVWNAIKADPAFPSDNAVIMNGDISYARGWPWIWELFANETEEIFTSAPVMASYGNHEYDYGQNPFSLCQGGDSGGEAGIPTQVRFDLEPSTPWYHMAMGPVTLISLSSEHSVTEQANWLAQILPQVNRNVTPFLVVFLHRPIHESSTWIDHELAERFEESYTDLFSYYGVDLVLSGHSHYYERMCPISSGECATYGFRPGWSIAQNQIPSDSSCVREDRKSWSVSLSSCKVTCMYESDCTGVYIGEEGHCNLITCPQPFSTTTNSAINTYSLTRFVGQPPVYIVDGTAGGAHTPTSSPNSKLTVYKDFSEWGYSRFIVSGTQLTWNHYHIDGTIVDTMTLSPSNAGGSGSAGSSGSA